MFSLLLFYHLLCKKNYGKVKMDWDGADASGFEERP